MKVDPQKYVTFKRDELWTMVRDSNSPNRTPLTVREIANIELTDAVVIRLQDMFAPIPLYSYAYAVRNAREVILAFAASDPELSAGIANHMEFLSSLADYFAQRAFHSEENQDRQIPT